MPLKLSRTSCVFRQVPVERLKAVVDARGMQAANDNILHLSRRLEATTADNSPSFAAFGPILVITAISGGTFYLISSVLSGFLRSFPMIYP